MRSEDPIFLMILLSLRELWESIHRTSEDDEVLKRSELWIDKITKLMEIIEEQVDDDLKVITKK